MELAGDHPLPAERERVFAALCDPDVLKRCIGPLEAMERRGPTVYAARVRITLGPLKARFDGRVEVDPIDPPGFYRVTGEGAGLLGFAKGVVEIRLTATPEGTLLSYRLTAAVGGRVGALASHLVRVKAERHVAAFFDRFAAELRA